MVHRPWYASATNNSGNICGPCQKAFEQTFIDHSVDLVLAGHDHFYERNMPIANGVIDTASLNNPRAPWYITNGVGGHWSGLQAFNPPMRPWSVFGLDTVYGWSKLSFHNCTHMTHDFVASANSTVLDTATLFKDRKC